MYNLRGESFDSNTEFFNVFINQDYKSLEDRAMYGHTWLGFKQALSDFYMNNRLDRDEPFLKRLVDMYEDVNHCTYFNAFLGSICKYNSTNSYQLPMPKRFGNTIGIEYIHFYYLSETSDEMLRGIFDKFINKWKQENLDEYTPTYALSDLQMYSLELSLGFRYCINAVGIYDRTVGRHYTPSKLKEFFEETGVTGYTYSLDGHIQIETKQQGGGSSSMFAHISDMFQYSCDVTTLIPEKIKLKNETDDVPFYGVELEVSTDYNVRQIVSVFDRPFLIAKHDGSISGSKRNRMELVTAPASLRAQRTYWAQFFSKLDMGKFDTTRNMTNGMHVHIGRNAFRSPVHINKFSWFFNNPANRWFMLETSERNPSDLSYCAFQNYRDANSKTKAFVGVVRNASGKMNVVNHSKSATIEVRLFKGMVSIGAVFRNLELCDAVLQYTEQASIKDCTVDQMIEWLDKLPRSRYKTLRMWINALERQVVVDTSKIVDAIFGVRKKNDIIKIVNNLPIVINDRLVSNLNSALDSNQLRFSITNGKLTTEDTSMSKAASFDSTLIAGYAR